jgi:fibronectin-binding autotransporter adhesin
VTANEIELRAFNGGTIIAPSLLTANDLIVEFGAANAVSLSTNVGTLTTMGGGILAVSEVDDIALLSQSMGTLTVSAAGSIAVNMPFTVGNLTLGGNSILVNANVTATNISLTASSGSGSGVLSGTNLTVTGSGTYNTNVTNLTTLGAGNVVINEDDAINLLLQEANQLTVNASLGSAGDLTVTQAITVPSQIVLTAGFGNISINDDVVISGVGSFLAFLNGAAPGTTQTLQGAGDITATSIQLEMPSIDLTGKLTAISLFASFDPANTTTLNTNVDTLASFSGGTLNINEDNGIQIFGTNVNTLNVDAGLTGAGNVTIQAPLTVSTLDINMADAGDLVVNAAISGSTATFDTNGVITTTVNGKVSYSDLTVTFNPSGTSAITTNVDTLTSGGGGTLTVLEDNGITLFGQGVGTLNVTANQVVGANGDIIVDAPFSVATLSLVNPDGQLLINSNISGSMANLNASGGGGGAGKVSYSDLSVTMNVGNTFALATNVNNINLTGGTFYINEDNSINVVTLTAENLDIDAGLTGNGNITLQQLATVGELELTTFGDISPSLPARQSILTH